MTTVSTPVDETAGTDTTRDGDRTSATSAESDESAVSRGADDGHDSRVPAGSDDPARDGADEGGAGGDTVRVRLVESTVVAAITGVFVVLSGSTQVAPRLSLPVALAGVLWLFVRTLSPMKRRRASRTDDDGRAPRADVGAATAAESTRSPGPDETPVSTDRRLKLEVADHGGRMMQKDLVETVDLSESAVSRRLSRLESEDDEVGRVCLGRENMVFLAGHRPDGADSPFADDTENVERGE